jgi:hypothetical protein
MTIRTLIGSASRPMTKDESGIFLAAIMNPALEGTFDEDFAEELGFSGKVLERRLAACTTAKITKGLAVLVVIMSNGNPGNLVMWAYTFHKMNKGQVLTINDFANEFPMGVPSEEGFSAVWDSQKNSVNGGNLIDDVKNWN